MNPRRAAGLLVAAVLCAARVQAETFQDTFKGKTAPIGQALAETVARSFPVISASPGLTFHFDPASGAFERETDLIGQVYLERARPVGRGKWNLTLSYQHVHVDSVQGQDLDGLRDVSPPIVDRVANPATPPVIGPGLVKFDRYSVDLSADVTTLGATYGITDDMDVNLTLPILASRLSVNSLEHVFTRSTNANQLVPVRTIHNVDDSTKAGLGDLILRGKYRLLNQPWAEAAAGLLLRIPTGSKRNFQGTGDLELSPALYVSARRIPIAGPVAVQVFLNGSIDVNISNVDESQGRYGAGVDLALGQRATLSIAFLGRQPFQDFAKPGAFDVPRFVSANDTCQFNSDRSSPKFQRLIPGTCPRRPLFGLDTTRPSYYSLSIGGRVNLWRDTLFGFANVLVPLTDQGIHTAPIPLVGFEATF